MEKNGKQRFKALRAIAAVLANLTAILSANYIVFYILDHYNPGFHFVVRSEFILTKYLHFVIPILMLLTALLYLLIFVGAGAKAKKLSKKRLIVILIVDVLLAGAFAMTVNARAFGWVKWLRPADNAPVAIATMPPKPTEAPTVEPTAEPTSDPVQETQVQTTPDSTADPDLPTLEPTEVPTPAPTPIPGLLGDKYKEKFADGQPFSTEPNTSETLADGTERTLIYTYAGKNAAFEIYRCKKGKVTYQIADVYVRDIANLTAAFEKDQNKTRKIRAFAEESGVLVAVSSDYFAANANDEGLIIRNGMLIRSNPCKHSDLCVIYQDGTMRCFDCKKDRIDNNEILGSYPYHSFYFGPSLLDENGGAKTKFNSSLSGSNPRTVLGYYEPGHYAFISVLGDYNMIDYGGKNLGNSGSPGMTLSELSTMCEALGMKAAYNLDGGRSIGMYWNGTLFGHNMRAIGDIIAVTD